MKKSLFLSAFALMALVGCKSNTQNDQAVECNATEAVAPACAHQHDQACCDMEKPCCKAAAECKCLKDGGKCECNCAEGKCCCENCKGECCKKDGVKACMKHDSACAAHKDCRKECPKAEGKVCEQHKECQKK